MRKEDIVLLAQLLSGMKDALEKVDRAYKTKNFEELNDAKREMIHLQSEIGKLL